MTARKYPGAFLRRSEADNHVRVQKGGHADASPIVVRVIHRREITKAALDVPPRRDVDRHDRQAGAGDERERRVERGAHGRLEGETEDRVEDDVGRCERGRERVLV